MKARIPLPGRNQLSPAGLQAYESILKTRGNLDGPFLAWLHSPGLAIHAEKLGAFCRYGSTFSTIETELLILCTARYFRCRGEWEIHVPIAIEMGLGRATVEAILAGVSMPATSSRLGALHDLAAAVLRNRPLSAEEFGRMQDQFGNQGMVEAVGILGYYTLVAMTLNAFEMTAGEGTDPFASCSPRVELE